MARAVRLIVLAAAFGLLLLLPSPAAAQPPADTTFQTCLHSAPISRDGYFTDVASSQASKTIDAYGD